jgi:site-specific recombinase XerD
MSPPLKGKLKEKTVMYQEIDKFLIVLTTEGKAKATIKLAKPSRKIPEPFSDQEVKLLLKATKHTRNPQRDKSILLALLDSGMRVSELVKLGA